MEENRNKFWCEQFRKAYIEWQKWRKDHHKSCTAEDFASIVGVKNRNSILQWQKDKRPHKETEEKIYGEFRDTIGYTEHFFTPSQPDDKFRYSEITVNQVLEALGNDPQTKQYIALPPNYVNYVLHDTSFSKTYDARDQISFENGMFTRNENLRDSYHLPDQFSFTRDGVNYLVDSGMQSFVIKLKQDLSEFIEYKIYQHNKCLKDELDALNKQFSTNDKYLTYKEINRLAPDLYISMYQYCYSVACDLVKRECPNEAKDVKCMLETDQKFRQRVIEIADVPEVYFMMMLKYEAMQNRIDDINRLDEAFNTVFDEEKLTQFKADMENLTREASKSVKAYVEVIENAVNQKEK